MRAECKTSYNSSDGLGQYAAQKQKRTGPEADGREQDDNLQAIYLVGNRDEREREKRKNELWLRRQMQIEKVD